MVSNLELQNKIAILLVSHGSSLPFAEVTFNEIKDKFNKATGFATEVGYMKVAEPSIAGAVENLKEEVPELEKIIAIPVFLAPGIHTNIDIPTLLGLTTTPLALRNRAVTSLPADTKAPATFLRWEGSFSRWS